MLSVKRRCAAVQPGVPCRPNLAKKWSDSEVPGGERDLTVWMDSVSGTISISAVLVAGCGFRKRVAATGHTVSAAAAVWRCFKFER